MGTAEKGMQDVTESKLLLSCSGEGYTVKKRIQLQVIEKSSSRRGIFFSEQFWGKEAAGSQSSGLTICQAKASTILSAFQINISWWRRCWVQLLVVQPC